MEGLETAVEATKEEAKTIKAIASDIVHKICSGQVVVNLGIAVKELVENAIDANATLVEVKLKDSGLDLIEVSDNGVGVEEINFEALTAKYHTSKIKEFCDLENVGTFGFRGEALSSLCALGEMVIVTRHKSADCGTKLELDHRGSIKKKSLTARQVGTTVSIANLFSTLPVRRREFTKNIKREFSKLCTILQSYCLISTGVRIMCTNQTKKGARTTILSTSGGNKIVDNISSIFGPQQIRSLIEMKPPIINTGDEITDAELKENSISVDDVDGLNLNRFKLTGWISSVKHGCGRSARDRQFIYVNSRPCEPKSVLKIINETYNKYNVNQNPFVFLNIEMNRSDVDVNITPDKRQVLVNNEKILLLAIKRSLVNTFGEIPSTYTLQNVDQSQPKIQDMFAKDSGQAQQEVYDKTCPKVVDFPSRNPIKRKITTEIDAMNKKLRTIQTLFSQTTPAYEEKRARELNKYSYESCSDSENSIDADDLEEKAEKLVRKRSIQNECIDEVPSSMILETKDLDNAVIDHTIVCKIVPKPEPDTEDILTIEQHSSTPSEDELIPDSQEQNDLNVLDSFKITITDQPNINQSQGLNRNSRKLKVTVGDICTLMEKEFKLKQNIAEKKEDIGIRFKEEINPRKNKKAEAELEREISKDMFAKMEIIGQFNLGFVIVRLDDDLFIIDQHASDEKFNFEDLQNGSVIQSQQLVIPLQLELTVLNEMILIDNLHVFEMNGFKLSIDHDASPTRKVKLLSKPISKNYDFGKADIDELIFMLQDAPNTMCRPSKVQLILASRACRKSVMIGKALSKRNMRHLIDNMGKIEHPWNCPHGRPTMRHLINLKMIEIKD